MLFVWTSCEDDEVNAEPDFSGTTASFTVAEDISDTDVIGILEAQDDTEELVYSILANDNGLFEIDPASGELSLASDKSLNYEQDETHEIAVSVSDGSLSDEVAVTITVTDVTSDNVMSFFSTTEMEAYEESGESTITVSLDQVVVVEGATASVMIDAGDMVYGTDYTTEPAAVEGVISLPVELGLDSTTFKLQLVNNQVVEDDKAIVFTLANGEGNIVVASSTGTSSTFTVLNDDTGFLYLYAESVEGVAQVSTINPITATIDSITSLSFNGAPVSSVSALETAGNSAYVLSNVNDHYAPELCTVDLSTGELSLLVDFYADSVENFPNFSAIGGLSSDEDNLYLIVNYYDEELNWPEAAYSSIVTIDLSSSNILSNVRISDTPIGSFSGLGNIGDNLVTFGYNPDEEGVRNYIVSATDASLSPLTASFSEELTDLGLTSLSGLGKVGSDAVILASRGVLYLVTVDVETDMFELFTQLEVESSFLDNVGFTTISATELP